MSRAALLLAASAAAQAPVNVTVVALALPAYGEATTRVWRALGVEGLHVGCGPALRSGALNSDLASPVAAAGVDAPFVGVDGLAGGRRYFLRHDATEPFPLPDGAVDYVYAEHFIEHVPRSGALAFLRDARRLLSRGGVLVASTFDATIAELGRRRLARCVVYVRRARKLSQERALAVAAGKLGCQVDLQHALLW